MTLDHLFWTLKTVGRAQLRIDNADPGVNMPSDKHATGATMSNITDLLYIGTAKVADEFITEATEAFPAGKFERDYDDIHEWRVEVEVPDIDNHAWYKFLMKSGWHSASFSLQLTLKGGSKKNLELVKEVLREVTGERDIEE